MHLALMFLSKNMKDMTCKIAFHENRFCHISKYTRLALLSLHHILDLAATELMAIGKQMLKPLEGDRAWISHSTILDEHLAHYNDFLEALYGKLKNTPSAVGQAILTATMDISYPPLSLNATEAASERHKNIMMEYARNGHYGVAHILQIQLLQHKRSPTNEDVEDMIHMRNSFIDSIPHVLQRQHIEHKLPFDIDETQLFVPRGLFRIPAVVKAIEEDGRRDCLWRPIGHMLYDNEVGAKFRLSSHEDGYDVLGRSRLHIACALGADKQHPPDMALLLNFGRTDRRTLGLSAFHIAAIHGNTHLFHAAATAEGPYMMTYEVGIPPSVSRRTSMHWAACFAHLELVEYFVELHKDNPYRFMQILDRRDQWVDTPLHLAARNGHTDVVKALLPHTDWIIMAMPSRHTPFWAATTGCHLDIMKLLQPFFNVDEKENQDGGWLTPLAEASRQGFVDGVQYLLNLEGVTVNSINGFWNKTTEETVFKTPLDLAIEGEHAECVTMLRERGALTKLEIDSVGGDDVYGMEG
jgi:ankyrin repeat protein